jgi:hypothetical protein
VTIIAVSMWVYAFSYADVNDDAEGFSTRHVLARDIEDARQKAIAYIDDDGLRDDDYIRAGVDYQVIGLQRLMRIDWPIFHEPEGERTS